MVEHEDAICKQCGNYTAICSTPEGVDGHGYNVTQGVCYVSMIGVATRRRIERKFAKTQPDLQGYLPTDGVTVGVSLYDDDGEDLLGLADDDLAASGNRPAQGDQAE